VLVEEGFVGFDNAAYRRFRMFTRDRLDHRFRAWAKVSRPQRWFAPCDCRSQALPEQQV
jgi:hypothetical protein